MDNAAGLDSGLLAGRTAIVTGAGRGIGRAIATVFAGQGANVVLADVDGDVARSAAEAIGAAATGHACDVTSEAEVADLFAATVEQHGAVDIVVNNAGITRDAMAHRMSLEQFRQVVDVHLQGTWLGTREGLRHMRSNGRGGAIINMASVSGRIGNLGQTNYSAAKAGIVGLSRAAAKEGARFGIRVNAIQPGLIRTRMTEAIPQQAWEQKMADIPLGRPGEPEEVANVALFLASELSSYVTGAVIEVTGGRAMG